MFRIDDETKKVLVEVIELLGYLALGITFWELTKNVYFIAIYVLLSFCLLLLLRYRAANREIDKLKDLLGQSAQSTEELQRIQGLFQGMLGLFLITAENPFPDRKHHFTFVQEEYVVHGDDGIYNWILQGCNVLHRPSQSLIVKFAGDTPVDISSLALSVLDKSTGQRYSDKQIRMLKDLPYLKVFELLFAKPISEDECFDLSLSCRWDNTFARARRYDYVFFAWGYCATQGIDKLVGRLVCDVPIADFVLEKIEAGRLQKEHSQPKLVDTSSKHFVLEWEVSNPQHVYLLRFTKEVPDMARSTLGGKNG
jgi:hypothetical protein